MKMKTTIYIVKVAPDMVAIKRGQWATYTAVDYDDALMVFQKWRQSGAECCIVRKEIIEAEIEFSTAELKKYWGE